MRPGEKGRQTWTPKSHRLRRADNTLFYSWSLVGLSQFRAKGFEVWVTFSRHLCGCKDERNSFGIEGESNMIKSGFHL